MRHRALFLAVTLLAAVLPMPARSQGSAPNSTADERAAELRTKAFKLLESVAEQVGSLQSPENRARIGSNVADLLWHQDEKRSRDLMQSVAQDLRSWSSEIGSEDSDMIEFSVLIKLRSDIIDRLAKRDLEVALDFLRSTRHAARVDPAEKKRSGFEEFFRPEEVERRLELQLAERAAARNPKFALQLAREIITRNLSPDVIPLLTELNRSEAASAKTIYKMLVDQLRETPLESEPSAIDLSFQLARAFRPPAVDEQVYRSLLGVVLAAALNTGCGNEENTTPIQCYQIGSIFPALEKYYGPRTAPLKRWAWGAEEVDRREGWEQAEEVQNGGTIDEILELAGKHPEMRNHLNLVAIQKAEAAGDLATARKIAESTPDEALRRSMLAQLDERQKWGSINAQKLAALQQTLSELPSDDARLGYIFEVVRQLGENDRKAALGLLDQAGQIIERSKSPRTQLFGKASLALLYSTLNSDRGFPILEALMPKLNELVAASVQLDGLEFTYVRNGEWNMSSEGMVGGLLVTLAQNAEYFARVDFDRSVALTNQLQRAELRLMAQEKIAQGILAPTNLLSVKVTPPLSLDALRVRQLQY